MRNPRSVKKKLDRKVIHNLGFDTTLYRSKASDMFASSGNVGEVDMYGEPLITPWPVNSQTIRIVIDTDKMDEIDTQIGGLSDPKKEYIYFYCSGDIDLRIGDKVAFPANSENRWEVSFIQPYMLKSVCVIQVARAFRDARY